MGRRRGGLLWQCQCICGNVAYVVAGALASGNTNSCGCLRKEIAIQNHFQVGDVFVIVEG